MSMLSTTTAKLLLCGRRTKAGILADVMGEECRCTGHGDVVDMLLEEGHASPFIRDCLRPCQAFLGVLEGGHGVSGAQTLGVTLD